MSLFLCFSVGVALGFIIISVVYPHPKKVTYPDWVKDFQHEEVRKLNDYDHLYIEANKLEDKLNIENDGRYLFRIWCIHKGDFFSEIYVSCMIRPIERPSTILDIYDLPDRIQQNNSAIKIIDERIIHSDMDKKLKDIEWCCQRYIELTKNIDASIGYKQIINDLKVVYSTNEILWSKKDNDRL